MISKRYNKLFNNFEGLKKADAKYQASLDNINQVKKELRDIKNIGKLTSKKSNIFFDDIKLNYNQIDIELNHLRDAILTDQIFDNSEVEILNDKFEDIFNISHSLNTIKNILDKKNVITDILYLELDQSIPSFSKLFKTELNNILNQKKTTKGVNRDLINFKNILGKYTEFDQKTFDEIKNKNGIDISELFLNEKYVVNICSGKQIDNVENYIEQIFTEISNFNGSFNELLNKYEKHINSSASQINQKIKDSLENKTLKNENLLEDIETILNTNKTAYEQDQDKKEAEAESLRLEKEAEEERLKQEEEKRLIDEENAKKSAERAKLEEQERKKRQEKFYTFLGYFILFAGALLCLWGLWELSIFIWMNYADFIVGAVTTILVIFSGIIYIAGSKVGAVVLLIATVFIYGFLDDLVPKTTIKENKKTELAQEIKEFSKKSEKLNQIIKCPMSGYKDNCQGEETYNNGTYNGLFKNNKRHGHGTYNFKSGDKYSGQWNKGNKHGQGTYYYSNGDKYSGQWNKGNKHGQGTYYYPSGNKYVGQWKNDYKHGQGTMIYKNGLIEKGIWENNKFIGSKSEKSFFKNQIKAKDTIKSNQTNKCPSSGYKDNCIGRITYTSGNVYEGSFKNNKRHGQGTFYFNKGKWKGDKYIGQWKDNKYNGQGSYFWKDGSKYVGQWKNDDKHGQGTMSWPSGNKYMGQWKNDKQHGQGTKTYSSGKIEKGIWENGKFMYAQGSQNP